MRVSHTVNFKQQIKAIERMAKLWLKNGPFEVTFQTIGDHDGPSEDSFRVIGEGKRGGKDEGFRQEL